MTSMVTDFQFSGGTELGGYVQSYTALLVTRDERNIIAVRDGLARKGCKVLVVSDGLAAIDSASAQPVNVVILDGELPGVSGTAILKRFQNDPELHVIPVLSAAILSAQRYNEPIVLHEHNGQVRDPLMLSSFVKQVWEYMFEFEFNARCPAFG